MPKQASRRLSGEGSVILSLSVSLGIVLLTIAGLWLWKLLAPVAGLILADGPADPP
jgi:hypothetical protein